MHILNDMTVVVEKQGLLEKLHKNREEHKKIVIEARVGYMKKAREALAKRLKELEDNKLVHLSFSLEPPQDYTKVYDTAIQMLEMHTEPTVELNASQVRHLAMNQWDWMDRFLASNAPYSDTARAYSASL
jgi:hypothetical protein